MPQQHLGNQFTKGGDSTPQNFFSIFFQRKTDGIKVEDLKTVLQKKKVAVRQMRRRVVRKRMMSRWWYW